MWITEFLARHAPLWDKEGEGAGGATGNTGGDAGTGVGENTGIANADDQGGEGGGTGDGDGDDVALNGGTADGQDNSSGEEDGDNDGEGEGAGEGEVPEAYDFSGIELPEGMELDTEMAEAMSPAFKDLGLTQDQANKLVGVYAERMQKQMEANVDAAKELVTGWKDTAKADQEIGGNNWKASVDAANAAIRKFGTPELVQDVMVGQGMGNHPEVIRMFARIGKAIADDRTITGEGTETGGEISKAEAWYGATTPKSKKG